MQVLNYDKDLDQFSTLFNSFDSSGINKYLNKINKSSDNYQGFFKDVNTAKDAGLGSTANIKEIANNWELADKNAMKYASTAKGAVSMDGFTTSIKTSETTLKSFGSSLASIGKSVLSFGANMLAGFAIGSIIDLAITGIYNLITANEQAIESGKEALDSISTTYEEYNEKVKAVTSISQKYTDENDGIDSKTKSIEKLGAEYDKLYKGINKSTNANIKLSDEDYQSYLDISNQLSEIFPQLQINSDSAGNAVLNLGRSGKNAAEQLRELVDAQQQLANYNIGNNLNTSFKGYQAQAEDLNNEINKVKGALKENEDLLGRTGNNPAINIDEYGTDWLGLESQIKENRLFIYEKDLDGVEKVLDDVVGKWGYTVNETMLDGKVPINIEADIDDTMMEDLKVGLTGVREYLGGEMTSQINEISSLELQLKESWNQQLGAVQDYLKTSDAFTSLNDTLQNGILTNLDAIDPTIIQDKFAGNIKSFLYSEYITPLSEMKPETQEALTKIFEIDPSKLTNSSHRAKVQKALETAFPDDKEMQKTWGKRLGFDSIFDDASKQQALLMRKFGNNVKDIRNLTGEDREFLFQIAIEDSEFNGTYEQAMEKMEHLRNQDAISVNLKPTDRLDAATAAKETENGGDRYLKMKELFEQAQKDAEAGLLGTDDFKKTAQIISPNNMDDISNWHENLSKVKRYFTDNSSGMQNFLDDLSTKTNEAGTAMASFDENTGKWKLSLDDLEGSANNMGLSFEAFMAITGRLEDYGFINNFVGSVEDGVSDLSSLYSELGTETQKLSELKAKKDAGDQTVTDTVISAQEARVQQIRDSITETGEALNKVIAQSIEKRNQDIEGAKAGLATLSEERQKLIDNPETYGDNTSLIRKSIEDDMSKLAGEYGITLDANFNIDETPQDAVEAATGGEPVKVDLSFMNIEDKSALYKQTEKSATSLGEQDSKGNYLNGVAQEYARIKDLLGESDTVDLKFNVDTRSMDNVGEQIDRITEIIQLTDSLHNEDGSFNFEAEGADDVMNILNGLLARSKELKDSPIGIVVDEGSTGDVKGQIERVKEFGDALRDLNALNTYESIGISVDSTQLDGVKEKVANYLQDIAAANNNHISISADVSNAVELETLKQTLSLLPPDVTANVTCNVTGEDQVSSVKQAVEDVKNAGGADVAVNFVNNGTNEQTINYKPDTTQLPESFSSLDRSVIYKPDTSRLFTSLPTLTQFVQRKAIGGILGSANGTAHALGTTHSNGTFNDLKTKYYRSKGYSAYVTGDDWGLTNDETALVNELGMEGLVRDGVFSLITGGAHLQAFKKGDIIFNHQQVKELLRNGMVTSNGGRGTIAHASGTAYNLLNAHASGSSSGSLPKKKTTTKKSSSKSSSSKAKSGSSGKSSSGGSGSSSDKKDEDLDWIETKLKRLADILDRFADGADYYTGYLMQNAEIEKAIAQNRNNQKTNEEAYVKYIQKANSIGLSADYAQKVRDGQINIETIGDEDLRNKISDYQKWYDAALDCKETIIDLNKQLRELAEQKLDNILDDLNSFVGVTDTIYDMFDALNEMLESQGKTADSNALKEMIGQKNNAISYSRGELQNLKNELNKLVSQGLIKQYSQEWYEWNGKINDVQASIYDSSAAVYELREELRQLNWKPLTDALDNFDNINEKLEDMHGLFEDMTMFDINSGAINKFGLASLGLNSQLLANSKKQVAYYSTAIETLHEELAKGDISQEQFNEQLKEYEGLQRNAISDVKQYRDAILDLVKDGIDAETNAMQKLINKRKEDLNQQKANADYARTLRDKTTEINKIQAQIKALEGDPEGNKAKIRELKNKLTDAQRDLKDTQDSHSFDVLQDGYDAAMDTFEKIQEEEIEKLNTSLEAQNEAIASALQSATDQYSTVYDVLNSLAEEYSLKLSGDISDPWKSAEAAVNAYLDAVGKVQSNIKVETGNLPGVTNDTNQVHYGESVSKTPDNNVESKVPAAPPTQGMISGLSGYIRNGDRGSKVSALQTALNALGFNCGNVDGIFGSKTLRALRNFQSATGVSADGIVGPKTKAQFASRGYVNGVELVPYTGLALTDEKGIGSEVVSSKGVWRQMEYGDTVFNNGQVRMLYDFSNNPKSLLDDVLSNGTPANIQYVENNSLNLEFDSLVHIDSVGKDSVNDIQNIVNQSFQDLMGQLKRTKRKLLF